MNPPAPKGSTARTDSPTGRRKKSDNICTMPEIFRHLIILNNQPAQIMKAVKKLPFPISAQLSFELRLALAETLLTNTAPPYPEFKKRMDKAVTGERAYSKDMTAVGKSGAGMPAAWDALQEKQADLQAREAILAAAGFTFSTLAGCFEKPIGNRSLVLYADAAGESCLSAALVDGKEDVARWEGITDITSGLQELIANAESINAEHVPAIA